MATPKNDPIQLPPILLFEPQRSRKNASLGRADGVTSKAKQPRTSYGSYGNGGTRGAGMGDVFGLGKKRFFRSQTAYSFEMY